MTDTDQLTHSAVCARATTHPRECRCTCHGRHHGTETNESIDR